MTHQCDICGKTQKEKIADKYHYIESGLDNVYLNNITVFVCEQCKTEIPLIPRIKNLYHKKILLKIAREESPAKVKKKIFELISHMQNSDAYKAIKVQADVDPM